MGALAKSPDPDKCHKMQHFIRVCIACQDKNNLKKYNSIWTFLHVHGSLINIMDHPDLTVSNFIELYRVFSPVWEHDLTPRIGNFSHCFMKNWGKLKLYNISIIKENKKSNIWFTKKQISTFGMQKIKFALAQ